MTTAALQALEARALNNLEGEARWWFGQLAIIKATAKDTGGGFTLVEIIVNAGYETPLHVHHNEDEGFWMVDGSATFTVGHQTIEAGPGAYLFGPKDVPHKWKAGPNGARLLYLFGPAGFENLIREMSVPALALVPPPPDVVPPANAPEIAAKYGIELLP
jgi:mannose-6-phosphate isomerase-like protein (cupin superfamily)